MPTPRKKPVKKAAAKKAPAKKPTTKAAPKVATDIEVILPGDDGYMASVSGRGKPDVVSPVLDPVLDKVVESGINEFQLPAEGQFTVLQVRHWATKQPTRIGLALSVSGGTNGKNIHVKVKDANAE